MRGDDVMLLSEMENILFNAQQVSAMENTKLSMRSDLEKRIADLDEICRQKDHKYGAYCRAASIIGRVSDENTETKLSAIMGVINRALALLFTDTPRTISITQTLYRNAYPHFNVTLTVEGGKQRTFKQSGTGLAQVVSFLCTACLIDARGGRKIMVMDELLNGLHPDAKGVIKDLILALSNRFQFVVVEYNVNIGKQYEVVKSGGTSTVSVVRDGNYFSNGV